MSMIFTFILLLLSSNAVTLRRDKSILYSRAAISMLTLSFVIPFNLYMAFSNKGIGLYGGLYQSTSLTQIFHIFILTVCAVILQLTAFYPRKIGVKSFSEIYKFITSKLINDLTNIINKRSEQFKIIEYALILLFIISGAVLLVCSSDLVSLFLSVELQSYALYLVCTIYRNSELSTGAGLTYFLLGGLSSCFILLSTGLIYANSGTTNLDGFYVLTSLCNISWEMSAYIISKPFYLNISLVIMSVGFLFKVSAAPFHFWSPDVYDAIPTIVTTFVAIVAKISILIFFLELAHYTSNSYFPFNFSWRSSLLLSSLLSLIIGSVLGLTQFRIKRLFAYSTISHLGFILLSLAINTLESIQAFIFYLMQYTVSNLNAFFTLNSFGFLLFNYKDKNESVEKNVSNNKELLDKKSEFEEHTVSNNEKLLDRNNSPIQLISQIKGYFYLNSYLALCLAVTLFSFVGIPPLAGFFAKQMVLSAALDSGYAFITLVAILTSVISAVYYLALIKQIFFEKIEYMLNPYVNSKNYNLNVAGVYKYYNIISFLYIKKINTVKYAVGDVVLSNYLTVTISSITLFIVLFVFTPQETLRMANILALILFNT